MFIVQFHKTTPDHLPKLEPPIVEIGSVTRTQAAQEVAARADAMLGDIDELTRTRLAGTARNMLRLDLIGVDAPVMDDSRQMERHRGAEGFSPNTINAVFSPREKALCTDALAKVLTNYRAWTPDIERDPNSIW